MDWPIEICSVVIITEGVYGAAYWDTAKHVNRERQQTLPQLAKDHKLGFEKSHIWMHCHSDGRWPHAMINEMCVLPCFEDRKQLDGWTRVEWTAHISIKASVHMLICCCCQHSLMSNNNKQQLVMVLVLLWRIRYSKRPARRCIHTCMGKLCITTSDNAIMGTSVYTRFIQ